MAPPRGRSATPIAAPCISAIRLTVASRARHYPPGDGLGAKTAGRFARLGARNAGSAIHAPQLARGSDGDLDRGAGCGMGKRVFEEVADCPAEGVGIAANSDRMVGAGDCNGLALRQRQRGR